MDFIKKIFFRKKKIVMHHQKWASVYFNHGVYFVCSCSGYRNSIQDPEAFCDFLKEDCTDMQLGDYVLLALNKSRYITPNMPGFKEFFNKESTNLKYEYFVNFLTNYFGNKSRQKIFHKMLLCHIELSVNGIQIRPTRKERGEAWSSDEFIIKNNILIPSNSTSEEVGKFVKAALSNCM